MKLERYVEQERQWLDENGAEGINPDFIAWVNRNLPTKSRARSKAMAERKKASAAKKAEKPAINVTFDQYQKMTPAKQKATLKRLRDTEKRSWRSIRLAWGKAPGYAQREYKRLLGEEAFLASTPLGDNIGRPRGSKNQPKDEAEAKPEPEAKAKPAAKKVAKRRTARKAKATVAKAS